MHFFPLCIGFIGAYLNLSRSTNFPKKYHASLYADIWFKALRSPLDYDKRGD